MGMVTGSLATLGEFTFAALSQIIIMHLPRSNIVCTFLKIIPVFQYQWWDVNGSISCRRHGLHWCWTSTPPWTVTKVIDLYYNIHML